MFTEIDHRGEIFNRKLKSVIQKERKIVHDLRENISKSEEETIAFSAASNLSIFTVREYLFSCGHRNKKKNDHSTNCHSPSCFEIVEIEGGDSFSATSKLSIFTFLREETGHL